MGIQRKPYWLCRAPGSAPDAREVKLLLRSSGLDSVCEEARCPNICECFKKKTATFLILGDVCTRHCRFCAVRSGPPNKKVVDFDGDARRIKDVVIRLGLKHVVITSVTRDDLMDGGASGFVATINAVKEAECVDTVEVLIPDFGGDAKALDKIICASPTVINHNLETVARLYSTIRPQANYERSIGVLKYCKKAADKILIKTGIMLGLGESMIEVKKVMDDAKNIGVDIFTAGQYMQPTRDSAEVVEYIEPEQFRLLEGYAAQIGFSRYAIAPLVRSSYNAEMNIY